jgi:hypothetical protein
MQKVNDFLFDLVSLFVPGVIVLIAIVINVYDVKSFVENSETSIYYTFIIDNPIYVAVFVFIIAYILGSVLKVISKVFYKYALIVFDDGVFTFLEWVYKLLSGLEFLRRFFGWLYKNKLIELIVRILKITYLQVKNMLTFKTVSYSSELEEVQQIVTDSLKEKSGLTIMNWQILFKYSNISSIRNNSYGVTYKFLSKYNFYRSLVIVMLFLLFLPYRYGHFIDESLYYIIVSLIALTSNVKYKYYWYLCGNEALMELLHNNIEDKE